MTRTMSITHAYIWLKILLIFTFAFAIPLPIQAKEKVRFVYFEQFEPFSWNKDGQMRGIFIDAINEVFHRHLKVDVSHEGFPWFRAQQMVKTGDADGMCTIRTDDRLTYTHPTSTPIVQTKFKIFTGINNSKIEDLKKVRTIFDLKEFSLIDILGSGWARANLIGFDVHYEKTYSRIFLLLEKERYDASIRNDIQTNYLINKFGYKGRIVELPQSIIVEPQLYCILISKKSIFANRINEINHSLKRMNEDGILLRILDKYTCSDQ